MTDLEKIKRAYEQVVWMAIRYANGRHTYAGYAVRNSIASFKEVFPEWTPEEDHTLRADYERSKEDDSERRKDWLFDLVEDV